LEFDDKGSENKKRSPKENLFLIRDLLGLTSEAEWKGTEYNNAKITKANSEIDRFKSPITYKPILFADDDGEFYRVFLFFEKIPEEFLAKSFNVKVDGIGDLVLDTPDRSYFSLTKYFSYLASDEFEIDDLINKENRDTDNIRIMFNNLKTQDDEE
jgi:hypothetical protein